MPSILAWTAEEDAMLRALIEEHGTKKWSLISSLIQTKSSKQCRRRWKNNVDMEAKATTWTPSEDAQLIKHHRELGNKWTQISKRFGDRTDNAVKNRWHALCKKQPELAEEESPVTTVGVRRGTRTRQFLDDDDDEDEDGDDFSTDFSEESEKKIRGSARKKPRRGAPAAAAAAGSGGGGTRSTSRGTTGITERSSGRQPSRLGPSGLSGGTGTGTGDGHSDGNGVSLRPTPFDRAISRRGAGDIPNVNPSGIPPVSIVVPPGTLSTHELLMAQQLNAKGTPFQIEVAELPRDGTLAMNGMFSSGIDWIPDSLRLSDGSGSGLQAGGSGRGSAGAGGGRGGGRGGRGNGGRAVIQGALNTNLGLNPQNSAAVGGFGGTLAMNTLPSAANINSSLSINDLLNWLNSTTAELPAVELPGGAAGASNINNNNAGRNTARAAQNNNNNKKNQIAGGSDGSGKLSTKHSSRSLTNSGSLHASLSSGSSGLSSGQRDLLARLFSQVRDSAELRQQQWQQQLGGLLGNNNNAGGAGGGSGEALMTLLEQPSGVGAAAGGVGGPTEFQRMLSLGLGGQRSLSLGFNAAATAPGMGSLPLGSLGSLHTDPSGSAKTRSSSGRGTSAFTEAADAAIAAIDNEARNKEAAMAATAMAEALVRQHSTRALRRGAAGGGGGGGAGGGGGLGGGVGSFRHVGGGGGGSSARAGLSDVPVMAPQYSAQDIDTLIGALAIPKAR